MILKGKPCKFLRNKKCTIYSSRPFDCRSYPHLHKKDFTFRLFAVLNNYSVCPIVFNVYEELKVRMGINH
jgi:Fe-S-cluster containining protein